MGADIIPSIFDALFGRILDPDQIVKVYLRRRGIRMSDHGLGVEQGSAIHDR